MAAPMTAAQWRAQMKKWGVDWAEYPGWTTRKRPGSFAPVGVVIHHTGSDAGQNSPSYDHFLFVEGRPAEGIPGPLCQAADEMDGDVIQGAIGRANHAGSGSSRTLAAIKADNVSLTATLRPGPDDTNGNGWLYGIEVKFDGGQPMTAKQYDSCVRWAAAICDFYGWTGGSIVGHKEWSSRKPDPGSTDMAKFRRDVNARLKAGPGVPKPPSVSTGGVMSLTTTDLANVNVASYNANSRYGRDFWVSPSGTGTYLRKQVTGIEADAAALKADVATLKADVASLKQTNAELKSMLATALAALPKA
jgi:N-acetylmuramoyl-L-alanine amidase.